MSQNKTVERTIREKSQKPRGTAASSTNASGYLRAYEALLKADYWLFLASKVTAEFSEPSGVVALDDIRQSLAQYLERVQDNAYKEFGHARSPSRAGKKVADLTARLRERLRSIEKLRKGGSE